MTEIARSENEKKIILSELTSEIVSAYVSNNAVTASELPILIKDVFCALESLNDDEHGIKTTDQKPAVNPKKSVFPDYIICLEDGKKFKSLKRHLTAHFGLSPQEYRDKWNLPSDYPMVAPSYSAKRASLARQKGLGRKKVS